MVVVEHGKRPPGQPRGVLGRSPPRPVRRPPHVVEHLRPIGTPDQNKLRVALVAVRVCAVPVHYLVVGAGFPSCLLKHQTPLPLGDNHDQDSEGTHDQHKQHNTAAQALLPPSPVTTRAHTTPLLLSLKIVDDLLLFGCESVGVDSACGQLLTVALLHLVQPIQSPLHPHSHFSAAADVTTPPDDTSPGVGPIGVPDGPRQALEEGGHLGPDTPRDALLEGHPLL
mmetsp:Transcript_109069/g.250151  ORF Transcript_109069/g.250151 Transcript_109069/m.250151 type:complete len:225 (-) Transcript_109069:466-1140(-)